jgi:hypothetical protein
MSNTDNEPLELLIQKEKSRALVEGFNTFTSAIKWMAVCATAAFVAHLIFA